MRQDPLRKLARSTKYQNLYTMAKELSNIQLFENIRDFSKIQSDFLFWLFLYNRLYTEINVEDNKYLTKEIIENDLYLECYLIWEQKKKRTKDEKKDKRKVVDRVSKIPAVKFIRGRK